MSSYSVAGLLVIAFAVSSLNGTVSSSSRSTLDKCVRLDIRVVHSQKAYFNGVDQNRTTVPKVGPKGEKGERGLRGIVGPKGGKGSTGDDSGIKQLENRLAEAEQLITELMAFKGNITEKGGCFFNIFKSCKAALEVGCSGDGIFHLQPKRGQSVFKAFCDMNGGWTLIMKIDGRKQTFLYDSNLWTNSQPFNPSLHYLDDREAKLPSYWTLPFTELRLGMKQGNDTQWITTRYSASSLYSVIADGQYRSLHVGRDAWKSLIRGSSLQYFCNKEGFNAAGQQRDHHRVRIGIIANNERDCGYPDSRIGFGGSGRGCVSHHQAEKLIMANSCGNVAHCEDADKGDNNYPVMGYVMAR